MTSKQEKELQKLLKHFKKFLRESISTRLGLEKARDRAEASIKELDKLVLEQRQAASGFVATVLGLNPGDSVEIKDDGTYEVILKQEI